MCRVETGHARYDAAVLCGCAEPSCGAVTDAGRGEITAKCSLNPEFSFPTYTGISCLGALVVGPGR